MNKAILLGRLTKDAEMRTAASGTVTTTFTLAINRTYTNQAGEKATDFINCIAFNKTGETIAKYTKKGNQLLVEGRIQTRSYEAQDGTKRYNTEVVIDGFTFVDKKETTAGDKDKDIVKEEAADDPFKDFGNEVALTADDLPF